jgi:hypothetical protein
MSAAVDFESYRLTRLLAASCESEEYRAAARRERVIAAEHQRHGRHGAAAVCLATVERHERMARMLDEKRGAR